MNANHSNLKNINEQTLRVINGNRGLGHFKK